MSKLLSLICGIGIAISLTACSEETAEEPTPVVKEPAPVKVEEQPKVEPVKTEITFAEFDNKYERDPDYESYQDGLFLLKDGTELKGDYIHYMDDEGFFDYASAIFYDGKLVNLKIETDKSYEEVEAVLGVKFTNDVKVDYTDGGFKINFDERFAIENIKRLPNEWE